MKRKKGENPELEVRWYNISTEPMMKEAGVLVNPLLGKIHALMEASKFYDMAFDSAAAVDEAQRILGIEDDDLESLLAMTRSLSPAAGNRAVAAGLLSWLIKQDYHPPQRG